MPITARISKDHKISSDESLVILSVYTDGELQEYVAIAKHPDGGKVSFRAVEKVDIRNKDAVFSKRIMFNGRNAEELVNSARAATLESRNMTLDKSVAPRMTK